MQTRLCGATKEVLIERDAPFVIIGESINPTRRRRLIETLQAGDFGDVERLARSQIDAGADVLDINVGIAGGGVVVSKTDQAGQRVRSDIASDQRGR